MARIDLTAPSNWLNERTKLNGMTTEIYAAISALVADQHNHTNKTILDAITAAFTSAEKTKLANITDKFKGLFANAAARNAAVTTPTSGDYVIQIDTNTVWYYSGATWVNTGSTATGDMLRAVYDPTSKNADSFSMGNMVETAGNKIFTSAERAALAMYRGTHDTGATMLALTSLTKGNWCTRIDTKTIWLYDGAAWVDTSVSMAITGAASTIVTSNLTASRVATTDANGKMAASTVTDAQLASILTLGSELKTEVTRTLTADTAESLTSLQLTVGKWFVWGGFTINQSGNAGAITDYVCALLTSNPTAYTNQTSIADEPFSIMVRMVGGQDAAATVTGRVFTSSQLITLRAISSFTTNTNTVEAGIYAVKIGI